MTVDNRRDIFVSVVVALRNEASVVESYVAELGGVLAERYVAYEIVLVDDGSTDRTVDAVRGLLGRWPMARLLVLSRSFGDDIAITAGLDTAIGDIVVTCLTSDPPDLIPELVGRALTERKSLVGVLQASARWSPTHLPRDLVAAVVQRVLAAPVARGTTQFRVLSRQAVGALLETRDRERSLALLTAHVGYGAATFSYTPRALPGGRAVGRDRTSLSHAVSLSVAGSRRPLHLASAIGVAGSLVNVLYAGYVVLLFVLGRHPVEGWTTLSLELAVMFFLLFMLLAVMAEYLGHLLTETRDRPLYFVVDEFASGTELLQPDRRNVLHPFEEPAGNGEA